MDFESDYVKLVNQSKTVAGRGNDISVSRRTQNGIEVVTVSGQIGRDANEKPYYKSITRPDLWAGHSAVQFLASRGVKLKGDVRSGKLPTSARQLAVAESRPIAQIIADMMKWSSNFSAETISRLIAVQRGKTSVTAEDGRLAVANWLSKEVGLPSASFKLVNVAGFNRGNEFRARDLGKILSYAQTHFQIYPEFLTSMPVAGVDGTLRSRFKALPGAGWVRAKTGLLDGVVGLSGYAGTRSGQIYRFVFIFNGPAGRGEDARQLFDRLASALVSDG
jgi:D-alanyl-D-alanine carboxypeptidase/D-alanyl-D-alanine-endopeptidase (penicillin-binding protein 4)